MKSLQRSTLALALAACWAAPAGANPTNPQVVAGQVAIAQQGKLLTITNSDRSIINWGGFSIAAGETTRFVQSGAASAVLNRVTGAMPSELLGQLQSNGRVYLINPNGIVIGNGARIDTAGFIASSLALSDADFLSGRLRFGSGDAAGSVINRGAIHGNGSLVALIGAQVENHGSIESAGGSAVAAAARGVELVDAYSPNIRVRLDTASDAQLHRVLNRGVLTVAVPAASDAAGLRVEGGRIRLVSAGDTLLEGNAVASADNAAGHGGSVHVLGTRVGLFDSTIVGAGGTAGGGEILVGGDYQGRNPDVINATRSFVGKDVALTADAIGTGDGGKVIVWADEVTRYHGHASVKGGAQGGNGGLVEVSGKQALEFRGSVALDAPLGRAGTLLLDPLNITVQAGAGTLDGELTVPGDPTLAFGDATGVTGTLDVTELTGFTSGTVELQADNDITVNTAVTMQSGVSLKLAAINNVNVNANVTTSGGGNLRLEADTDASGVGAVTLGSVTIDAPLIVGDLGKEYSGKLMIGSNVSFAQDAETFGLLTYSAGSLSVASGKTLTLKGGMNWTGGVNINGPGTISLPSGQTLAMSGAATRGIINAATFNNAGTTTSNIGGSQLVVHNSSIFNNSGTFRFLGNGDNISVIVGTGTFNNTGTLEVSGAITNAVNNVAFTNTGGTLASGTGTLNLPAGGSHSGNITITGTGVRFNGGTHSFADSTTIAGQLNLVGATANFGTVTTNGLVNFSSGAINVTTGDTLTLNGGMNWTGGVNINGPGTISLPSGQTLAMSGAASRGFINTTFNNAGTTTSNIGGSQLVLNNSSIFNNTGTFRFLGNGDNISVSVGTGTFNNTGTLEVSGAITNAVNNVALTNTGGTLASGTGTLNLNSDGSHSGAITITGTAVNFAASTHSFADSTTIAGQLNVAGATANFGTVTTNGLVNFSNGAITVTTGDTLTLNGGMNWTGGVNINGPGTISLPSGQTLAMSGAASRGFINAATFNNAGTTTSNIGGSQLVLNNSSIFNNSGTFRFLGNGDNISVSVGTGTFNNTGTLEVSGAITNAVNNVAFTNTGGTLASGTGTLNLNSDGSHSGAISLTGTAVNFAAGTHSFADSTTIAGQLNVAGATANFGTVMTNGLVNFSSGAINVTSGDTLTLNGGMNWTGGVNINGPGTISLPSGQTLAMSGAATRGIINAATFNNAGTTTSNIGGSQLVVHNSSIFNNSGTFRFLGNGDNISVIVGTGTFNNTGTLEVSGAITNAVNNVAFTNTGGTLASGTGTLNLPAGGSHSGNITITGTGVRFNGGTHSFADSTTIAGQLNLVGATANFGTVTTNGLVNFSSGAINVTTGDTLTLNGGMNWTGGVNINGPGTISLPSGQTLAMSGAASRGFINTTFNNAGTTTSNIGGSQLVLNNSSIFNNTGTFRFLGNGDNISVSVGTGTFNNTGTLEVSGAITNAVNNVALTNTGGTLASGTGTLNLNSDGSHSGAITITGTAVNFAAGTHNVTGTLTAAPGSAFNVTGATVNLGDGSALALADNLNFASGAINLTGFAAGTTINAGSTLTLSGQNFGSTGKLTNQGTFNAASTTLGGSLVNEGTFNVTTGNVTVSGGVSSLSGAITVAPGRTLDVAGTGLDWQGGTLAGTGTYNLTGGLSISGSGARVLNGPTFTINNLSLPGGSLDVQAGTLNLTGAASTSAGATLLVSGGSFTSTGTLANAGTFSKSSAGTTTIAAAFSNAGTVNANAGVLDFTGGYVQSAGQVMLGGGALAGNLTLNGGTLGGAGTLTGNLVNTSGIVAPGNSPGLLTVAGDYTQGAGGQLNIELGGTVAGTGYDRLSVAGNATLDGTVFVTIPGAFAPGTGDLFDFMTIGGIRSGSFATTTLPTGYTGNVSYPAGLAQLQFSAVPATAVSSTATATTTALKIAAVDLFETLDKLSPSLMPAPPLAHDDEDEENNVGVVVCK
jgi:filamentous hemagglutinin family protein